MTEWLKDFFYYTPTERRGYVAMLSIILIGRGLPALYPYFYKPFEQDKLDLVQASKNAAEYKALFKKNRAYGIYTQCRGRRKGVSCISPISV